MSWWSELYDEAIGELFLERPSEDLLISEIDFLWKVLELAPDQRLFDQCCGTGSQSIPLACRGLQVVGVDQAEVYIDQAKDRAAKAHVDAQFHQGDAFTFVPDQACQAALCWGTSFGNADNDAQNLEMIKRAFEALAPGGLYALEFPNMAFLLHHFMPTMTRENERVMVIRESTLDLQGGALNQVWTVKMEGRPDSVRRTSVRLYMPNQLADMLAGVGFTDIRLLGDLSEQPLSMDHARCIAIGRKP